MLIELVSYVQMHITIHISYLATFSLNVEKWAMAYRHFEHKDTDTNMFVERYVASYVK